MTQVPIAEGLFTLGDEPQLIGSRCPECGTATFPAQDSCPGCPSEKMEEILFPRRGTLWSFTTQEFRPKDPYIGPEPKDADWQPYAVGYLDLGDVVKVEARLTESDWHKLKIGEEMELVLIPFGTDDDGNEVVNFAFAPVTES
jgi:uncharacterized OB-fold protein